MGIPMWREPCEADALKTAVEKDVTAAGRSSIRRSNTNRPYTLGRALRLASSFRTQIMEGIQRGANEPQAAVRSPVLNLGVSEDGMDLETSRRDALASPTSPSESQILNEQASRRSRDAREVTDFLAARAEAYSRHPSRVQLTPGFAPAMSHRVSSSPHSSSSRLPPPGTAVPSVRPSGHRSRLEDSTTPIAPSPRNHRPHVRGLSSGIGPRDPPVDGLGDRQRSPSADGTGETDPWDDFLTTVAPGAVDGPSLHMASSSSARPTHYPPHRRAQGLNDDFSDQIGCEPSSSSSDDEDDYRPNPNRPYHRRTYGPYHGERPAHRNARLHAAALQHATISNHPPVPNITSSIPDSESPDLQQMRAILDRLARREDIPDDWWAAAGLSRILGRDLDGTTDHTDNAGPSSESR
ncbi:hypothetical protein N7539_006083 [Penicillium diatomitis]|uniref:Uncharacterized protein n=1 Tax=Penicillium diatomitis TaxID=2819901 RepID=A0A9W9X546_9EURO|nr:uncharacterized protein N7539_006083 [Penicillium diatomitis]KAJ5483883.1 hypothetical protein N7539_006083 [Penicillium diatomitis]